MWRLMGGWYPERLPVLLAMIELEHIDGLPERLLVIRAESMKVKTEDDG